MLKRGFVAFIFLVVILLSFSFVVGIDKGSKPNGYTYQEDAAARLPREQKTPQFKGYIVEFKNPPLVEERIKLEREAKENPDAIGSFSDEKSKYEDELKQEHVLAINDMQERIKTGEIASFNPLKKISDILKKFNLINSLFFPLSSVLKITGYSVENPSMPIEKEFYYAFNGVVLDVTEEEVEKIKESPYVKNVYPNNKVFSLLNASIKSMEIDSARNYAGLDGSGVTIAVIDTGIDAKHESLDDLDDNPSTNDPKVIGWKDYVNFKEEPYDDNGHGTHCSGIAAGTGGSSGIYKGVAPKARLVGVKVLDDWGSGWMSDVIAGIEWTIQNKQKYNISIISMSLGSSTNGDGTSPVEVAADYAVALGINFVVAAGNSGPSANTVGIPASAFNVITVGAVDNNLKIASFSSRGPTKDGRIKPEISAVGVGVTSSVPNGTCDLCDSEGYTSLSGTSMATPHVAGFVALLIQSNPSLNTSEIKDLLIITAVDAGEIGPDNTYGFGVLNGLKTVFELMPPQHEVYLKEVNFPKFLEIGKTTNFSSKIENLGYSTENITVQFLVDDILMDNKTLSISAGQEKQVNFSYNVPSEVGKNYTLTIKVLNVSEEAILSNNEKSTQIKSVNISGSAKAFVLESWGTKKSEYTIFEKLNNGWMNYGDYAVEIDYKSLDKEDITYQDLLNSGADVLIISNAWTSSHFGLLNEYTDSEIDSIKQYVEEGHGLIATAGTMSEYSLNNAKLGELFGLKNKTGLWNDWDSYAENPYDVLVRDNWLTKNIDSKYYPGDSSAVINLEFDSSKGTIGVAKVIEEEELWKNLFISAYKPLRGASIYFTGFPEYYYSNEKDAQFLYNAIVWTRENIGLTSEDSSVYNLSSPDMIKIGENFFVSAIAKNNGNNTINTSVEIFVDNVQIQNKSIGLTSGQAKEVSFNLSINSLGKHNLSVNIVPSLLENYMLNNKLEKVILVPQIILNGSFNDYGLDTNGNGLYDYIVVEIGVDVFGDGYYDAQGDLQSFLGVDIDDAWSYGEIHTDNKSIKLKFPASKINRIDLDGPYKIKNFNLEFEGDSIYGIKDLMTTKAYKVEDFELPSKFTKKFNDYGLDNDGDGLYNNLIINAEINVKEAGEYLVYGDLYGYYYYLTYAQNKTYLNSGIRNVSLSFRGDRIKARKENGPYTLENLKLYLVKVGEPSIIQDEINEAYETSDYDYIEFQGAADLSGYINYTTLLVGQDNNISVKIYNYGGDATENGKASLYYQKDYCSYWSGECDSLTLIETKNILINAGGSIVTSFMFNPPENGWYTFILILNASNNIDTLSYDSIYLEAKLAGADLSADLNSGDIIINRRNNITATVYNYGTMPTQNGKASLYYQKDYCYYWGGECDNLSLINTTTVSLDKDAEQDLLFQWTPVETGDYTLVLILNASNEIDYSDDVDSFQVYAKPQGPDPGVYFSELVEEQEFFINKENNVSIEVENLGTQNAANIKVSLLYANSYCCEPYSLAGEKNISNLIPGEIKEVNISWTPMSSGEKYLKTEIESVGDIYSDNNEDYRKVIAVKNETDVLIDNIYTSYSPVFVGQSSWVSTELLNLGKNVNNIDLNLYDNGVLIDTLKVPSLDSGNYHYQSFNWEPTARGNRVLRGEVIVTGDSNTTNNEMTTIKYVYGRQNITFRVKDSNNNPVRREIGSEYTDEIEINGNATIGYPNITETGEIFNFGIINYINLHRNYFGVLFNTNLNYVPNYLEITSDFYNKTSQDSIDYFAVFANEPSIAYSNNSLTFSFYKDYLSGIGFYTNSSYDMFYCQDFNFQLKKCNAKWKEAIIDYIYDSPQELYINAHINEPAEAFALSESLDFNGNTTNLSSISNNSLRNLIIERANYGRITFLDEINITRLKQNESILNDDVFIGFKKMSINTSELSELSGKSAELLFRNINLNNPQAIYNGVSCPTSVCSNVVYERNARTIKMNVNSFSLFEIVEGPYCGDTTCQSGETCSNCVADCGSCPPPDDNESDDGSSGDNGNAATLVRVCNPSWQCEWSPCSNNIQRWVCVDKNLCGKTTGKPPELTKPCFVASNCTDNDRDGYGVGSGCLGPDLNDNDPGITNSISSIPQNTTNSGTERANRIRFEYAIIFGIIIVILMVILIIVIAIVKSASAKKEEEKSSVAILEKVQEPVSKY